MVLEPRSTNTSCSPASQVPVATSFCKPTLRFCGFLWFLMSTWIQGNQEEPQGFFFDDLFLRGFFFLQFQVKRNEEQNQNPIFLLLRVPFFSEEHRNPCWRFAETSREPSAAARRKSTPVPSQEGPGPSSNRPGASIATGRNIGWLVRFLRNRTGHPTWQFVVFLLAVPFKLPSLKKKNKRQTPIL